MNFKILSFLFFFLISAFSVFSQDSDSDNLSDREEVLMCRTNPLSFDADNIVDFDELNYWGSNWSEDSDHDGLTKYHSLSKNYNHVKLYDFVH